MTPFTLPDFQQLQQTIERCTSTDVEQALNSRNVTINDLAALISPAAEPMLPEMARRSALLTAQRFGRTTQLYAPIYLSNYCTNRCAYCGCVLGNGPGERKPTADHYQAASHGGPKTYENCVAACGPCNSARGNGPPMKFFNRLRSSAPANQ